MGESDGLGVAGMVESVPDDVLGGILLSLVPLLMSTLTTWRAVASEPSTTHSAERGRLDLLGNSRILLGCGAGALTSRGSTFFSSNLTAGEIFGDRHFAKALTTPERYSPYVCSAC